MKFCYDSFDKFRAPMTNLSWVMPRLLLVSLGVGGGFQLDIIRLHENSFKTTFYLKKIFESTTLLCLELTPLYCMPSPSPYSFQLGVMAMYESEYPNSNICVWVGLNMA